MNLTALNSDQLAQQFFCQVEETVAAVSVDKRDPWPSAPTAYFNIETLYKGNFGNVSLVQTKINHALSGVDVKKCILKSINLSKQFYNIIQKSHNSDVDQKTVSRISRLLRRTVMDLYVIGKCRHQNIIHAHSVFMNDGNLMISMPRFHVLYDLVDEFRQLAKNEPMPMTIIAPIIRQICRGLDHLQHIGIIHRDVQPNNVLLTRNGTVKLCHFGQSKVLTTKQQLHGCKTPVGKEEFMCAEKLSNLVAAGLENCRSYGYSADIWSLGVMVLSMISYFPNERHHRLHRNFALIMEEEQATFMWLTAEMVQLRARLLKSGGNELKSFLSNCLLNPDGKKRPTASELVNHPKLLKWCSESIEKDKAVIKKLLIDKVDFANKMKIQRDGMNFDYLECKDIPAEFYWNDDWKTHDSECYTLRISKRTSELIKTDFQYYNPDALLSALYKLVESEVICFGDVIPIRNLVDEATFDLIRRLRESDRDQVEAIVTEYEPLMASDVLNKLVLTVGFGTLSTSDEVVTRDSFNIY
ncbi:unnamed protein product [Bursaphelenchus okinawaensis]|uniref:Protein kinase domain-containing protein n=1 Tax=Bursaphelenchus okinawaensis TaxID=465554 RepID=A0A811JSC2_9BILA|nr:unnamed protein product [Bursaphelenchus okinawaensis]CAG9081380.1 unnamed protein product [Bursaphelenchus okinawaensis]